jgi:hemoglobin-like flavoprotein
MIWFPGRRREPDPAWSPAPVLAVPARPPGPHQPGPPPPPVPRLLDIAAIRRSLASVTASPQRVAGDFYGYLFAAAPQLRAMFPPAMNAQNERLFAALTRIAGLLDAPDLLAGYLGRLGCDHRKYGVAPEHYAQVGDALMRALRRHCTAWDDRTEAAWGTAYAIASDSMIAGAQACGGPPAWRGRVLRHRRLARDLAVLDIMTGQPLPYEPGQYITLQHGRWPRVWRQFSVASPPGPDGDRLELNIRMVPGGWVSTALTRDTAEGDEVLIGPAAGDMTAEAADGNDLLLIAGGVGLAPRGVRRHPAQHRPVPRSRQRAGAVRVAGAA